MGNEITIGKLGETWKMANNWNKDHIWENGSHVQKCVTLKKVSRAWKKRGP